MKNIIYSILITTLLLLIGCNNNKNVRQEFYPSGQLKYEVDIVNDLRHGTETEYYEDGSIKMRGTRINDEESGFYYYYNMNQQLDSIIEYVLINIDDPLDVLFEDNEDNKNFIAVNRQVIYKNREIDYEKSVYFEVLLKKDTILLGDTIFALIDFIHQSNNQQNPFTVYMRPEKNEDILTSQPEENEQFVGFHFIPKTRGLQMLKGLIIENLTTEDSRYWFFRKEYYVK